MESKTWVREEKMLSNLSKMRIFPPKVVIFSVFMLNFAMPLMFLLLHLRNLGISPKALNPAR